MPTPVRRCAPCRRPECRIFAIGNVRREYVLQQPETLTALHPVHRGDETWIDPGFTDTAFATALDVPADDPKLEAEFLLHLGLPFDPQAGKTLNASGAMTTSSLWMTSPASIVLPNRRRPRRRRTGHLDGSNQRLLVVPDGYPAPERRLQKERSALGRLPRTAEKGLGGRRCPSR